VFTYKSFYKIKKKELYKIY